MSPRNKVDRPLAIGGELPDEDPRPTSARERGRRVAGRNVTTLQHRNGTKQAPRTRAEDGEPMRATTVHLPTKMLKRAALLGIETDESLSQLVERALGPLLERALKKRAG